jgi:SAM-dependent methyltransferase
VATAMSSEDGYPTPSWLQTARRIVAPVRPLLHRTTPISEHWGHERGTPIDRVYIDEFLSRHQDDIAGRVLEIRDHRYTDRFGTRVTQADVLDVDPSNPLATVIADLGGADAISSDTYDCFVLTQTLQYVRDPSAAVRHAHRILKPGGVLLATVPSIVRVDADTPEIDRWRFTELSCRDLFGEPFGDDQVEVASAGNVLAAVAFLEGLAVEELAPGKLSVRDPAFPVVILIRAVKPGPD